MNSIERLGAAFASFAERRVPSPFVFALILTLRRRAVAGFLSRPGGVSGSDPLTVATPRHFLEKEIGVIGARVAGRPLLLGPV